MAKFILTFNKQVIKEHPWQKEGITIGRNEDNSIVINNLAVSGYHARIDKAGSDFILTDLQSTNGTFVNNKRVVSHKLSHGDNIIVGKHVILYVASGKEKEEARDSKLDLDRTMMLDTARQRELLSKQEGEKKAPEIAEKVGVINFVDGSNLGEIELTKKLTKLGKADTSEVKLSGIFMGSTAATISRRPSGYTITFLGGMAKLKVNDKVIKESVPLKDFDQIELGSYKFQFYEKEVKKEE